MNITNVVLDRDRKVVNYSMPNVERIWDRVHWSTSKQAWRCNDETEYSEAINKRLDGISYLESKPEQTKPDQVKQERYLKEDGTDTIDKWATTRSHEVFREIMYAQVEKYKDRLGMKNPILEEVTKMADYMNRWVEYEKQWAKEDAE